MDEQKVVRRKSGPKPIGDRAMTVAERKARSRALALGGIVGHLDEAEAAARRLRHELLRLTPDAEEALVDLELHLQLARKFVPNS